MYEFTMNTYIGFKSLWMVLYVFDDATTWLICICFYNDIYIYDDPCFI